MDVSMIETLPVDDRNSTRGAGSWNPYGGPDGKGAAKVGYEE